MMHPEEIRDAVLVEDCAEFRNLFANYTATCRVLEEVEASAVSGRDIEQARQRVLESGRRWRTMLARLGKSAAQTKPGVVAKAGAVGCLISERPPECEIETLMYSLFNDVETVLRDCET